MKCMGIMLFFLFLSSIYGNIGIPEQPTVEISFVGDVYPQMIEGVSSKELSRVKGYFKDSHIVLCNLESPITNSKNRTRGKDKKALKKKKDYVLKSSPSTAGYLKDCGFTIVSLANNHVMDYNSVGLEDTIDNLKKYNIGYCGAGKNIEEAESFTIIEVNGAKVGIAGFSEIKPVGSTATAYYPGIAGIAYPPGKADLVKIKRSLKKAREKGAEIFIVSLHWGKEHHDKVEDYQREFSRKLLDEGMDCVIGHHPHVLRPTEIYKDKLIAYSLGNYLFMSPVGEKQRC